MPGPGFAKNVFAKHFILEGNLTERKDRNFDVYLATDRRSNSKVVLKLRNPRVESTHLDDRFLVEIGYHQEVSGKPNIVTILEVGKHEGRDFIVFEYAGPYTLSSFLEDQTLFAILRKIVTQILNGLRMIHARGIVHLDLNPGNIIIDPADAEQPIVRIHDFGLATRSGRRLSSDAVRAGYVDIMAPEQVTGEYPFSPSTDLYQVGALLHLIVTKTFPFLGTDQEIMISHVCRPVPSLRERFPELHITTRTDALVLRALEKDPEMRFRSWSEFANAFMSLESFYD
ncbi:serine/threonine protein kinase [Candidatus Micrarchaeota archaeon]|nr:serine/threonine protein kinase [Candidatus Micrarchaeota archaeon]